MSGWFLLSQPAAERLCPAPDRLVFERKCHQAFIIETGEHPDSLPPCETFYVAREIGGALLIESIGDQDFAISRMFALNGHIRAAAAVAAVREAEQAVARSERDTRAPAEVRLPWDQAPDWAQWAAMDSFGPQWWWYEHRPHPTGPTARDPEGGLVWTSSPLGRVRPFDGPEIVETKCFKRPGAQ